MATAKNTSEKIKKISPLSKNHEEGEESEDGSTSVPKKIVEIDDAEPVIGIDEKTDEDPLVNHLEDDDGSDEVGIDAEELNPFGDRWEE